MAKELAIVWSEDNHDCETCGWNSSQGATATLDGVTVFDRPACATCCNSEWVELVDVLKATLSHLGVEIVQTEEVGAEIPQKGLLIVWEYLDGINGKGDRVCSLGARAWLDGALVFEKPANLDTFSYTNEEEILRTIADLLGVVIEEEYTHSDYDDIYDPDDDGDDFGEQEVYFDYDDFYDPDDDGDDFVVE